MSISFSSIGNSAAAAVDPAKAAGRIASKLIKEFDTNKDGSLDKKEFVAGLTAKGVSADDAAKQFDAIDTKKTGTIDKADIQTAIQSGAIQPPPVSRKAEAGSGGGAPAGGAGKAGGSSGTSLTYDPADTNEDGTVSQQEALVYSLAHQVQASTVTTDTSKLGNNVDDTV